ncbi:MAG: flagellar type III secretion system pore protein FliP [Actinobacteria bacterium]|nr:flagellar type III secretion system pore protein FliP [Actinomycetota bacterium]
MTLLHRGIAAVVVSLGLLLVGAGPSWATTATPSPSPSASSGSTVNIQLPGTDGQGPNSSVVMLLALTVLAVAPAILLMMTSFTKIIVVLSLTRNALGLQGVPPNQVLAGLALFLSLFVMGPVVSAVNDDALQPYLAGDLTFSQAVDVAKVPVSKFMLDNTRPEELALMVKVSKEDPPATKSDVSMTTLIPAFVLSELRSAFIIGFVIFVPFLVIDMVVSAGLMGVGMMMLPPVMISLPFKLLLFVLVDGWGLVVTSLVTSYG